MDEGYIKLNRGITANWLWAEGDDPFDRRSAWVDLLLLASWKDEKRLYNGKLISFKRGTVHKSMSNLAERWRWHRTTVSRFLKLLESDNMVVVNATTHGTTITIVNWDFYQCDVSADATTNARQMHDRCTTDARPMHTIEESKESKEYINPPLYPPLEGETPKEKPKKKSKEATNLEYLRQHLPNYSFSDRMVNILEEWMRYKGQRKDVYTEIGTKSFLTKISNCVRDYGEEKVVKVITDSMSSGYAGVVYDWLEKDNKLKERTGYVSYAERGLR